MQAIKDQMSRKDYLKLEAPLHPRNTSFIKGKCLLWQMVRFNMPVLA